MAEKQEDVKKQIIEELTKAYWSEIETVMNYMSSSINLDGLMAEEIKESLQTEVDDELGHAKLLAKRIKVLGGTVPGSFDFKGDQKSLQPVNDTTNVKHVIKGVIDAESDAIDQYKKLIEISGDSDPVTEDLCVTILADEEEHKNLFEGYLKGFK